MAYNSSVVLSKDYWQFPLSINGTPPVAVKVSLFDLLFYEVKKVDGTLDYVEKRKNAGGFYGFNLSHDIILHDANLYYVNMPNTLETGSTSKPIAGWLKNGIDLAPVQYDPRAKHELIEDDRYPNVTLEGVIKHGWIKYNPDSALYPTSIDYFTNTDYLRPWYSDQFQPEWEVTPSLTVASSFATGEYGADYSVVLLGDRDEAFESMISLKSGYSGYNTIAFNPELEETWRIVSYLTRYSNVDSLAWNKNNPWGMSSGSWASIKENVISKLSDEINNYSVLRNTYVWLRLSFYGDYIKTKSFNQDLNQQSHPVYKNFSVSEKDNIKKFDEKGLDVLTDLDTSDNRNTRSENTLPYLPLTTPIIDLVSDKIISNYKSKTLQQIFNDPNLKEKTQSPIPAINRDSVQALRLGNKPEYLVPPGWFDADIRKEEDLEDLYNEVENEKPLLWPKYGNSFIDKRILSPSFDEIWVLLKKLIGGHPADTLVDEPETGSLGIQEESFELKSSPESTQLPRGIRKDKFKFFHNGTLSPEKLGDAIDYRYYQPDPSNLNGINLQVTQFISNPEGIEYSVYANLKRVSKNLTEFVEGKPVINTTLPWKSIDENENELQGQGKGNLAINALWGLREVPYSLRELELLSKLNKYNLVAWARFSEITFAITGKGKFDKFESNPLKNTGGTLYQFHKAFTYGENLLNEGDAFPKAEYASGANKGLLRYVDKILAPEIPESSNDVAPHEIYLAADGTWRSIHANARINVLAEEF